MKDHEHQLQVACIKAYRLKYPCKRIFAIPNGGQRHVVVAAKLKAEGVVAGVPDLFIPEPAGQYHGLFIEMKSTKGRTTPAQEDWLAYLAGNGYAVAVCRSLDEFLGALAKYFGASV